MKDFFEIETKQINDRRLQALIKDEGMAGVGTYFYLRCIIAGQSSDGVPVSYVIKTANVGMQRFERTRVDVQLRDLAAMGCFLGKAGDNHWMSMDLETACSLLEDAADA